MKELVLLTFFYLLSVHWWIFVALFFAVPRLTGNLEVHPDDGIEFGHTVFVFFVTIGAAFWYEKYVSKDVFVWVPALIVIGIMVATVKWATETIVRKTKTDTRSMGGGTTDTPRTSGSRASKSNPGLFSSREANQEAFKKIVQEVQREQRPHDKEKRVEKLYETIWKEIEEGRKDKGLWARLLAEHNGDEAKGKAEYLRTRVARLAVEDDNRLIAIREVSPEYYGETQQCIRCKTRFPKRTKYFGKYREGLGRTVFRAICRWCRRIEILEKKAKKD